MEKTKTSKPNSLAQEPGVYAKLLSETTEKNGKTKVLKFEVKLLKNGDLAELQRYLEDLGYINTLNKNYSSTI